MKFNQTTLKNGLTVVTVPMQDNPAVTVLVMVETGSKYEKKDISGLSHFLEHMVFKGTPRRPKALDIARELDALGASYNAFTSQEYTGYYAKVSPEHVDTALDVVSDIYLNPLLDQKEIDKEKGVIVEEIRMYQDMPHRHVHDLFMQLVYGDQPAGWNVAGTEETVKSFARDDFKKYMTEHYVAEATMVVVSGSFDEKTTLAKVEKAFANIPQSTHMSKLPVVEKQSSPQIVVKFKDTDQAHLVLGVRSFDARSPYDAALTVLATLLGGNMSSRLFQKLREEMGVGYYVRAAHDAYTDHGLFTISAGVDTARIEEVVKTLIAECRMIIDEPIGEDELKKVKDYIAGSFVLGLETSDSRAEYCATSRMVKGNIESPEDEVRKIQAVTVADLQKVARTIFVDEKLNLAIIGPYKNADIFKPLLSFKT